MNKLLFMIVPIMVIFACDNENNLAVDPNLDTYPYRQGKIYFEYPPMDLNGCMAIGTRGQADVFPEPHGGFFHREYFQIPTKSPLYAMSDGQITGMGKYEAGDGYEYWMSIQYSTTISVKVGHIGYLSDWLAQEVGELELLKHYLLRIPVQTGDTVGYISPYSALDVLVMDTDLQLDYCYPELYNQEHRYSADLFDYYQDPLRQQMLGLSLRQDEPRGGRIDYDVCGTIRGNWYREDYTSHDYGRHFSIVYHQWMSSRIEIHDGYYSYGDSANGLDRSRYWIKGNLPLPENIRVSNGMVKYEMINPDPDLYRINDSTFILPDITHVDEKEVVATYLFQLLDDETLKVQNFNGKTADQITGFTDNARIYVRRPKNAVIP